ncbi:MAG: ATP-dependent acyl-CoA ligase, partial [Gammaproteobacteria bacterium]|nr:ATP-dependent acyl-CoA ligase [Gammaproteobacteria bacterium]
ARDLQTATEIARRSLETLAYFKIPGYIAFVDALPLTPSEKPKRGDIKALAVSLLQGGQCYDVRHLKQRPRT